MNKKDLEEKKQKLSGEQYNICFLKGTEPPFSGKYNDMFDKGVYKCAVCDSVLFSSDSKFHSGSGWPAFDDPADSKNLEYKDDESLGMHRVEILCKTCGAHLGHLFDDGPTKSGKRYCVNSLALEFVLEKAK